MNADVAKKIVSEWLKEFSLPDFVTRDVTGTNVEGLSEILAILGPRRSGKTYFMYQLIRELIQSQGCTKEDILFVDFEDYRLGEVRASDVENLFVAFNQLTGKEPSYVFFDEVQHLSNWSRVLRTLHNRNRYKIVISGSTSELSIQEISTELRGRYTDLLIFPFSLKELLGYKKVAYSEATFYTSAKGKILQVFDTYLKEGGFPEVVKKDNLSERRKLLQNYYRTIFYRDIIDRYNVKAKHLLELMLNYFLDTYATLFSVSAFEKHLKANDLTGSKRTISNYLHYIENVFFVIVNEKFSFSPRKRVMNPKKIYLLDTGFTLLSTDFSANRGRILENAVAVELFRRKEETFYFKGKGECDFIIKRGTKPSQAIQVCWELGAGNTDRECRGMAEAMADLKIKEGLILTYDQEDTLKHSGVKIHVEPVWKWLLKGDHE